ncbi:MAG TPA: 4-(cytidine 5'-diphospho)-2-C-methyl-D-erythritol kinase [Vicinamibacterales bacterium]|nr:4-(cytidine 5'-diphospho)-2-C-methyl-D-erythritol kinase [Vicinamibacterales bacterium]
MKTAAPPRSRPSPGNAPTTAVAIRAHAKINLDLRVLGTRPDGFHELRTVFQSISLHDTLTFLPSAGPFTIECRASSFPLDRTNLIWQAADGLWRSLRRAGPVRDVVVRVDKQIPMQAGLGGGSANAAAALMGLARFWRVHVRPAQLTDVAATLGADVPFFLSGGTALGLGKGDEIYPLVDLAPHWIVLVVPGFGVSTADAYSLYEADRQLDRTLRPEPQHVPGPWPSRAAQMINDLEPPIARRHPEIDQMKVALRRAGALAAAMTGSGSTVFGLFQRRRDAVAAVETLSGSGWRALVTESLGRDDYARGARPRPVRTPRPRARRLARKRRID